MSSQRKRQAYQRHIFLDSQERGADEFLDPSFVPFIRPDGTSLAYKFLAPTTPPDYVDVETEPPTTPASSSSGRIVVKPAAKKILTQDIPVRLAPRIRKASSSSTLDSSAFVLEKGHPHRQRQRRRLRLSFQSSPRCLLPGSPRKGRTKAKARVRASRCQRERRRAPIARGSRWGRLQKLPLRGQEPSHCLVQL